MNEGLNLSSTKRNNKHDFPTPESPTNNNFMIISYDLEGAALVLMMKQFYKEGYKRVRGNDNKGYICRTIRRFEIWDCWDSWSEPKVSVALELAKRALATVSVAGRVWKMEGYGVDVTAVVVALVAEEKTELFIINSLHLFVCI